MSEQAKEGEPVETAQSSPVERLISQSEGLPTPLPPAGTAAIRRKEPGSFLPIFGIVIPLVSLALELLTRVCADNLFDPMPTVWHTSLVASVPLANIYLYYRLSREGSEYNWRLGFANGIALGVSIFYTVLFLPMVPVGIVMLAFVGLGVLPLTPPLALIANVIAAKKLGRLRVEKTHPVSRRPVWVGVAVALLAFFALELPTTIRRHNLSAPQPRALFRDFARDMRSFDFNQGSSSVGGILPGLSLSTSRIDGSIDPDAALGYFEWTMVFKNEKTWQQEARTQVALPHGGAVS